MNCCPKRIKSCFRFDYVNLLYIVCLFQEMANRGTVYVNTGERDSWIFFRFFIVLGFDVVGDLFE